jgi:hypothetical protein
MATNNQFTNSQLDVFRRAGFLVYENPETQLVSIVKYPELEQKAPLLIQLDYNYRKLTIIEQNIFNFRASEPPKYCAALPELISDTIMVLKLTKSISDLLIDKLCKS